MGSNYTNTSASTTLVENKAKFTKDKSFWEILMYVSFVTIGLISNVIAGKVIVLPFGLTVAGASILFPFVSLIDDLNTNCLGYQSAKKLTWISFLMNILMVLCFIIIVAWPGVNPDTNTAYAIVLSQSVRLVIGGQLAFIVSSFVNSYILTKLKLHYINNGGNSMKKSHIFLRTFGSSIPAVFLDAFIFTIIAFVKIPFISNPNYQGWAPFNVCCIMALTQFGVKILVELIMQPVLINVIPWFSKRTGMDVTDKDNFNPFTI